MEAVLVSIGGALGAVFRYAVGQLLGKTSFPWATLLVNAVGSGILGVVVFGVDDTGTILLLSVGFCGAFTTFSSFSFETVRLWERGERWHAGLNAAGNLVVSLLAFGTAWLVLA